MCIRLMERSSSMAFYTSRVDEDGNELEIRHTARTFEIQPLSTRSNISSRMSSRSVQYVNPAVYIEKNPDDTGSQMSEASLSIANSDIVPPLDLQSEENCPIRNDGYTFYRNHCEAVKLNSNPHVAYENWLSAKRKILSDQAARRRLEKEEKRREQEERKRLAEEKYLKWLESKRQEKVKQKSDKEKDEGLRTLRKSPRDDRDNRLKVEAWERSKRLEEERRRDMIRREQDKRKREEERRRQLSSKAWEKWIAEAPNKPKPVPLNQGIFTLRGTVSDIFINPNEWQGAGEV